MIANADMTEVYTWLPTNAAEVVAFVEHVRGLADCNASLTLTDAPRPLPDYQLRFRGNTPDGAPLPGYQLRFHGNTPAPPPLPRYQLQFGGSVPDTVLTQYRLQFAGDSTDAVLTQYRIQLGGSLPEGPNPALTIYRMQFGGELPDAFIPPSEGFTLNLDLDGLLTNVWPHVIGTVTARWGRQEAAFLARVLPLQMQVQLDNTDGRFDPERLLPDARLEWNDRGLPVAHGRLARVLPSFDHTTGLKTTTLHAEGPLAVLNNGDHELSLFITEAVRTGQVIGDVLDQVGWSIHQRRIDAGQVRIHPAHYTSVLAPRSLHLAGPVLRATEQAEVGLVHEERGNLVVFEDRFHRELDPRLGLDVAVFGVTPQAIKVLGRVTPEDSWDNIYNVIQVGADRAIVQVERVVYEWNGAPLRIPANTETVLKMDLIDQPNNRERDFVKTVIQWSDLVDGDFEFTQEDETALADGELPTVVLSRRTRTGTRATITNDNAFPVLMTKADLRGRGIALYGDLTIPELATADSPYRRRVLELPTSFIGDGLNQEGDGIREGNKYAGLLLARYDHPLVSARLVIDPLADAQTRPLLTSLQVSDPVLVQDGVGIPSGGYYVEGGDVVHDVERGVMDFGVHVSRRGRRSFQIDTDLDVQPASVAWTNVAAGFAPRLNNQDLYEDRYVAGGLVAWSADPPAPSGLPVMRVVIRRGGSQDVLDVSGVWTEADITSTPQWLGTLLSRLEEVSQGGRLAVSLQTRLGAAGHTPIHVTGWRIVLVES